MSHVPIFIRRFFNCFNPHVRQEHGQSVIETNTTVSDRPAQSWESRHILTNGDGVWSDLLNQGVGEHEIDDTIEICLQTEVFVVVSREGKTNTVMLVQDRGNSIESESVDFVLVKEPSQV